MAGEEVKSITLTTSDNQTLKVDREVAERSVLIKNLLEDLGADGAEEIPIPNVRLPLFYYPSFVLLAQANSRLHLSRSMKPS